MDNTGNTMDYSGGLDNLDNKRISQKREGGAYDGLHSIFGWRASKRYLQEMQQNIYSEGRQVYSLAAIDRYTCWNKWIYRHSIVQGLQEEFN